MRPLLYKINTRRITNHGRSKIAPFPGKYPTRVYWSVKLRGRKHPVVYLGKPVKFELMRLLVLLLSGRVISVRSIEFDRALQLVSEYSDVPLGNDTIIHRPEMFTGAAIRNTRRNTTLCHLYHPADNAAVLFGCLPSGSETHTKTHNGIRLAWYLPKGYKPNEFFGVKYLTKIEADLKDGYLWK